MIVIDVGCAPRGPESSIEKLIERFEPDLFYGFDPGAGNIEPPEGYEGLFFIFPIAAWTTGGYVAWQENGIRSRIARNIDEAENSLRAPALNLGSFIEALPTEDEIVLKLDCEGAEVPLLRDLHERGIDVLLDLILVEWHCDECGTGGGDHEESCSQHLRCPVELW